MNKARQLILLVLIILLTGCNPSSPTSENGMPEDQLPTLPAPQVYVTSAPAVDSAIQAFMTAWQREDYAAMYALVTADSQASISEEDFTRAYLSIAESLTLPLEAGIEYQIITTLTNPQTASALVQVQYNTNLFGTLDRELNLAMVQEAGQWRIQWSPAVIMPDLQDGHTLEIVRTIPSRGNIYANDGSLIAGQEDVVAIGFIPANLNEDLISLFYSTMADLTIYQVDELVEMIDNAIPSDYIALGEVPQAEVDRRMGTLSALSGVFLNAYTSRFYYEGGLAPQTVGHLTYVSEENLSEYLRRGYAPNSRYGATGLEYSFEDTLAGEIGASLYLKDTNGQIVTKLAEKGAVNGESLRTTIDPQLQYWLQQSLGNYRGAIVVSEINSGKLLAVVSNPPFDPNLFDINNQNFVYAENPYFEANDPVFNRATSGQYPLGSVSKIITMAAALDTGVFTETSELYCDHSIIACGNELFDWTYEKEKPPSGLLTLPEGLTRSCNPWFYYIGEQLVAEGHSNAIADMARAFGLGAVTGVEVPEQPGNIPAQISTCEMNAQLAIGQGEMTVTPLQVAQFIGAVGNGGTLYRPTLVEEVAPEGGAATMSFEPDAVGTLPISEKDLTIIQDAMRAVISNGRGTAHSQLATMNYRAYGKTGTAQNSVGISHAWFAGYTQVGNPDRPDIAVVVILENAGEGSEMAAPVFRRAVSLYFSNYVNYGHTLPWEAYPYVVASPTPVPTATPYGYEEPTEEPEE